MRVPPFGRAMPFGPSVALSLLCAASVSAQNAKPGKPEFSRQLLLIANFTPVGATRLSIGHDAGDAVRGRVAKLTNKRESEVIDGDDIDYQLHLSGYNTDSVLSVSDMRAAGKYLRADEFPIGRVNRAANGSVQLSGAVVLMRDEQMRQPIPDATGPGLDEAADAFAKSVAAARLQSLPERRCENALRAGDPRAAIADAREGIAAYPRSTLARTCLIWALTSSNGPAVQVLAEADSVLAVDSMSVHAVEAAAIALDTLHRRDQAAQMWLRFARTDTANLDLQLRVAFALFQGGNTKVDEPFVMRLADAHPEEVRLMQQAWRVSWENKSWQSVIHTGEALLQHDSLAQKDSVFYVRLATAYHATGQPYRAIETLARAVPLFPGDAPLYSLYTQYIRAEADTVVPRGLALFPHNADLLALNAKELRGKGKTAESLEATKQALELDPTMKQGELTVAQLEMELGHSDSALTALHRAVKGGEDSALVAQFALSKGNALYKAANGSKTSADFGVALRFLAYADSVRPSVQSTFLTGAAALGVATASLAEAVKMDDKTESCRLAHAGVDMIPIARNGLQAGLEAFGDAAKQSLDYLGQLEPYATQQLTVLCPKAP